MNILITGANGFLGKALLQHYSKPGNTVLGLNSKTYILYKHEKLEKGNYDSFFDLDIKDYDIAYHFGWSGTTGRDERSNWELQLDNVKFTMKFYQFCCEQNVKKFIYSASVYENEVINDLFFPENPKINVLTNVYGAAKISTNIFLNAIRNDKLPISIIRISNIYGIGSNNNRFINFVLKNIHDNNPMELSSGNQLYDFLYIDDAVEAISLIGEKGLPNKSYNLASGEARKLREYLIEIFKYFKIENYMSYFGKIGVNGKPLENKMLDITSLKLDFGYSPKIKFIDGVNKLYKNLYND